ncbi:hypothetical protein HRbin15_00314 [bacterium HR15]|nr:hypothetical protein HRbin15_00314 [bacterium HR15]
MASGKWSAGLALWLGVVIAWSQSVTPSFIGLKPLPGYLGSIAYGVSPDGRFIVGYSFGLNGVQQACRWSATGTVEPIDQNYYAVQCSFDGSVVVGQTQVLSDGRRWGFRWTAPGTTQVLPLSLAEDVSWDGTYVVGSGPNFVFRWRTDGTTDSMVVNGVGLFAEGISADGQTVVGNYRTTLVDRFGAVDYAFVWTPSGGLRSLGTLPNGGSSTAHAVSGNGVVVVGEARNRDSWWRAFRWTSSTGMQELGTLGGPMSAAYAASYDGSVIVGKSLINSSSASERAFRWTTKKKLQDLKRELIDAGVTAVSNWILLSANDVSADGTVVVGYGLNPQGQYEAFRATLPIPR